MLQVQTVEPRTLALLKKLMSLEALKDYYLVGGTSLALQFGHRVSIDIDLFGRPNLSYPSLIQELKTIDTVEVLADTAPIFQALLGGVKLDIVTYSYGLIETLLNVDGIRLASAKDIAAMKITAIGTRGVKKDFYDLYFLLERYSLAEIINFCEMKFPDKDFYHYIKALTYFEDADKDKSPIILMDTKITWQQVKNRISQSVASLQSSKFI